jgi:hypothetical protein
MKMKFRLPRVVPSVKLGTNVDEEGAKMNPGSHCRRRIWVVATMSLSPGRGTLPLSPRLEGVVPAGEH